MKLINVPQDVDEIIDLKKFKESIIEINKFNNNLEKFGNRILEKYIKPLREWKKFLSEENWKSTSVDENDYYPSDLFIFDYKNKILIKYITTERGWTMGASTRKKVTISFTDCGCILVITLNWKTQSAMFSHIPWIPQSEEFKINYITGEIL